MRAWLARFCSVGIACMLWLVLPSAQAGETLAAATQPSIEAARGGTCVEDPAVMRRKHMDYLKHQRDDTVHGGVRGAKYSLKTCIDCHASKQTNSVTAAPGNFCVSCHSFAAVKIDCFECHASHPAKSVAAATARRAVGPLAQLQLSARAQGLITQP